MTIRNVNEKEFLKVYKFVSHCKPLENYAEHLYKIILRYFNDTCFIVEQESEIIGFLMGFISQVHESTYFLWQIGISNSMQGKGIGGDLLEHAENKLSERGCKRIEVTIDPKNISSSKLFERMGYINISYKKEKMVKVNGNIAVKDYYSPGKHFMLYEKYL
ncbi:MAG: GNAT family N-acetyltransferase [Elusimicrobia bacterium]|nr:GNAT family N-acetyltransferase [Elusimicrobiota bacterium]